MTSTRERQASGDCSSASYLHTYSWATEAPGEKAKFDAETMTLLGRISDLVPDTHTWLMQPPGGNILQVNLKATYSPYVVVDPRHVAIDCYAGEIIRERSMFPWWNCVLSRRRSPSPRCLRAPGNLCLRMGVMLRATPDRAPVRR